MHDEALLQAIPYLCTAQSAQWLSTADTACIGFPRKLPLAQIVACSSVLLHTLFTSNPWLQREGRPWVASSMPIYSHENAEVLSNCFIMLD